MENTRIQGHNGMEKIVKIVKEIGIPG